MAVLALVGAILWLPFLSLLFLFGMLWPWVWFPCSGLGIFPVYSSLPFRLDLSGLGVGVPSQGPELALAWFRPLSSFPMLLCLWSDLLFLVPGVFLRPPFSGVLGKSFLSFSQPSRFFSRVLFSFWLGGEV